MGYERKTEKYSINLNVIFQVVSFDLLPWHPNKLREGTYHQINLRFYFLTFKGAIVNFRRKSLGKREQGVYIFLYDHPTRTITYNLFRF